MLFGCFFSLPMIELSLVFQKNRAEVLVVDKKGVSDVSTWTSWLMKVYTLDVIDGDPQKKIIYSD